MTTTPDRTAWSTGGPEEVADGVTRLPLPVSVEGLHAVNVYVLVGPDGVDLVDAGDAAAVRPDRLHQALLGIGSSLDAVRRVLVTHVHPDHYTLAPPIRRRAGAQIHLGAGERPNLAALNRLLRGEREPNVEADLARVGGEALRPALDPRRMRGRRGEEVESPDVWTADGDELIVAGGTLTAMATPGHTRGHVVYRDDARGHWFTGDHVLPHVTPSIGYESAPVRTALGDYLDSLHRLLARPDGVLLPAHGPTGPSTHARAAELVEHHETRLAATLDAVEDGGSTAYEVAQRLHWTRHERRFADLDPWHRYLAAVETAAHLDVLVARGALSTDDAGRPDRYRPGG
ncbi:MBL fold metallo-hydrolase [Streptomyces sp. NPDC004227]